MYIKSTFFIAQKFLVDQNFDFIKKLFLVRNWYLSKIKIGILKEFFYIKKLENFLIILTWDIFLQNMLPKKVKYSKTFMVLEGKKIFFFGYSSRKILKEHFLVLRIDRFSKPEIFFSMFTKKL